MKKPPVKSMLPSSRPVLANTGASLNDVLRVMYPQGIPLTAVSESPAQPIELQPPLQISIPEPSPQAKASQSGTFHGNVKPVRRLRLIDESNLDNASVLRKPIE